MKNVLESMEYVDNEFINEAECYFVKRKSNRFKYLLVAACLIVLLVGGAAIQKILFGNPLRVIAAEIGKEHIQFGAAMPEIINVTDGKVIMCDYVGIWVYDMDKQELVGFCDFRPIEMTQIQGDPCVFVEATADGRYVKFYMSDGSANYLYDVEENDYKRVECYDSNLEMTSNMKVSENRQLSEYSETYVLENGAYISYILDMKDDINELRYGDLIIIYEKDGMNKKYRPFINE